MKAIINILSRLHESSVIGKFTAISLFVIMTIIPFLLGNILFILVKPLISLAHLLLWDFDSAKNDITDWLKMVKGLFI